MNLPSHILTNRARRRTDAFVRSGDVTHFFLLSLKGLRGLKSESVDEGGTFETSVQFVRPVRQKTLRKTENYDSPTGWHSYYNTEVLVHTIKVGDAVELKRGNDGRRGTIVGLSGKAGVRVRVLSDAGEDEDVVVVEAKDVDRIESDESDSSTTESFLEAHVTVWRQRDHEVQPFGHGKVVVPISATAAVFEGWIPLHSYVRELKQYNEPTLAEKNGSLDESPPPPARGLPELFVRGHFYDPLQLKTPHHTPSASGGFAASESLNLRRELEDARRRIASLEDERRSETEVKAASGSIALSRLRRAGTMANLRVDATRDAFESEMSALRSRQRSEMATLRSRVRASQVASVAARDALRVADAASMDALWAFHDAAATRWRTEVDELRAAVRRESDACASARELEEVRASRCRRSLQNVNGINGVLRSELARRLDLDAQLRTERARLSDALGHLHRIQRVNPH